MISSFISCCYTYDQSLQVPEEIQNQINTILKEKYSFVYNEIEYDNVLIPKHWKILYRKFFPEFVFIANINNKEYYGVHGKQSNLTRIFIRIVIDLYNNIFIRKFYPMSNTNVYERTKKCFNTNLYDINLLACPDQFIFNLNDHNKSKQS
jgi:hypothetical protein